MLKDVKVVTSKFLELKEKLDKEIMSNAQYDDGNSIRGYGINSTTANFNSLYRAFRELCDILHEFVMN
jgi:hypothetical protein